jgi:hypothetical protein
MTQSPDTLPSNQGPPALDPYAIQMLDIFAEHFRWLMCSEVPDSLHHQAWDHFCEPA